ncbi:hypothetical protein L9F63_004333, partial [Diploptera punctata]
GEPEINDVRLRCEENDTKPWYMVCGTVRPKPATINNLTGRREAKLWPSEYPYSDRLTNQLMFVPPTPPEEGKLKLILMYKGWKSWEPVKEGREAFTKLQCPVDTCAITMNKKEANRADAIVFKDTFVNPGHERPPRQVWILFFLESPYHTKHDLYRDLINWTATYRSDSDVPDPYGRWVYYNESVKEVTELKKNYAANKTKKVAWFVSNCNDHNGRLEFAYELQKHIPLDIFGLQILSRVRELQRVDYITEKLYVNSLQNNVLPVVMGARPQDYARAAPHHSYIHVDDFISPAELANYLHLVDTDDDLYNSYFRWKGTGEFIKSHFLCRLCAMLHDDFPNKHYDDVNKWWRGPGTCTKGPWKK